MSERLITHLRHVDLAVPEFDQERAFYKEHWGLREIAGDNDLTFLAAESSPEQYIVRVRAAAQRRVDLIALAARDRTAVDTIAARLAAQGVKLINEPRTLNTPGGGYGFRFFDPEGRVIEISSDVAARNARELAPGEDIPGKLAHVVLYSANVQAAKSFYEGLGLRLSEWIGDFFCFLRVSTDHHSIAFVAAKQPALHHIAYELRGIDEWMRGTGRLLRANQKLLWGPGRHTVGQNCFAYFQAPNGNVVEYTALVQQITEEEGWKPPRHEYSPTLTDQWGTGILGGGPTTFREEARDPGLFVAPPV